jgi:ethanolamine utilization protein EutQ
MSQPTLFKKLEITYERFPPPYDSAQIARIVTPKVSDGIGAGVVVIEETGFDWTVTYDEVIYTLEGHLHITVGDRLFECEPGDVLWLPRGTSLRYESPDRAVFVYAVDPVAAVRWDLLGLE